MQIDAGLNDDFMEISVADTGTGVAAADLPHVFDRYFHSRGRAVEPGAGLGLAIVRRIVELHGGRVFMTSDPNSRTTVTFSLPLAWTPEPLREQTRDPRAIAPQVGGERSSGRVDGSVHFSSTAPGPP